MGGEEEPNLADISVGCKGAEGRQNHTDQISNSGEADDGHALQWRTLSAHQQSNHVNFPAFQSEITS